MKSDRRARHLAFIVEKPLLKDLPPPEDVVLVPLRWEILTLKELQGYQLVNPSRWLSGDLARRMQIRLDELWKSFLQTASGTNAEDYSFCFHLTLCPILYWKHIINEALMEFSPEIIWIPHNSQNSSLILSEDFFLDREKFLEWARSTLLLDLSQNYITKHFREKKILRPTGWSLRLRSFFSKSFRLQLKTVSLILKNKSRKFTLRRHRRIEAVRSVYIVSQGNKSILLRRLLNKAGIEFHFHSYREFEKSLSQPGKKMSFTVNQHDSVSPEWALKTWLEALAIFHNTVTTKALANLAVTFSLALHDASHHPLVRSMTREFLKHGKHVASIPEGAQYPSIAAWPYISNAWGVHFGEVRFALSLGEKEFYEHVGNAFSEIVVSGYFGSCGVESSGGSVTRLNRKSISDRRTRVFVDCPVLTNDWGLRRPGASGFEWYEEFQALIKYGDQHGLSFVTNLRGDYGLKLLLARSISGLHIDTNTPWYVLVNGSDVVVCDDSSVMLESLQLKKPAVLYHPQWFQSYDLIYSRKYQSVKSDVVEFASNPIELTNSIKNLVSSPQKDFEEYSYFLAQEQHRAVDWVKEKLAQPDV